jgi:hypothetical protein
MTPTLEMSLNLGSLSDVAAVLAADFEERVGDLLQGADPGGVHEHGEQARGISYESTHALDLVQGE